MLIEFSRLIGFKTLWLRGVFALSAGLLPLVFFLYGTTNVALIIGCLVIGFWVTSYHIKDRLVRFAFAIAVLLAYVTLFSLFWMRTIVGAEGIFYIVAIIAGTDIGGYFAGRSIGGPKLAPKISPNKTWAGLAGGTLAAISVSVIYTFFIWPEFRIVGVTLPHLAAIGIAVITSAILAPVSQMGDLLESWLKRKRGVKDSGQIIPGHGGILDRVDGYLTAAPLLSLMIWLHERGLVAWP